MTTWYLVCGTTLYLLDAEDGVSLLGAAEKILAELQA
jgi:hypothetical protein